MKNLKLAGIAGVPLLLALFAGGPALVHAKGPKFPNDAGGVFGVPKIVPGAGLGLQHVNAARPAAVVPTAALDKAEAVGHRRLDHPGIGLKHDKLTQDALPTATVAPDRVRGKRAGTTQEAARDEPAQSASETASPSDAVAAAKTERVLPTCR
jgi:hypothetical protein